MITKEAITEGTSPADRDRARADQAGGVRRAKAKAARGGRPSSGGSARSRARSPYRPIARSPLAFPIEFVGSFPDPLVPLAPPLPEVALIGRSNVGKSSLLNALTGRPGLARVSGTPGKTTLLNAFRLPAFYLVDLPGYGFARAGKAARAGYRRLVDRYLLERPTLAGVVWLLDVRHDPSKDDREMQELLVRSGRPVLVGPHQGRQADAVRPGRPRRGSSPRPWACMRTRSSSPAARPGSASPSSPTASSPPWEAPHEAFGAGRGRPARPAASLGGRGRRPRRRRRCRGEPAARRVRLAHPERPRAPDPDARRRGPVRAARCPGHPAAGARTAGSRSARWSQSRRAAIDSVANANGVSRPGSRW